MTTTATGISDETTTGFPKTTPRLRFLVILGLSTNLLHGGIPFVISKLKQLELLNLKNNQLTGPIPSTLMQIANLKHRLEAIQCGNASPGIQEEAKITELENLQKAKAEAAIRKQKVFVED
ncbi:hypothetical protein RHSIM_Rhsim12G0096100 [Rhododendron simsii]|uniref:Uncharacterized protein n=1 Tax=Rhododendron simsii TaxID=118357 RepID=A0A834LA68_RHOSS|nr:hypothetical protein RHSIM_Rhsim12G0096100 [Rhododendron simsii]